MTVKNVGLGLNVDIPFWAAMFQNKGLKKIIPSE